MGGTRLIRTGQSETAFSWQGSWGPRRDVAAGARALVCARAAPIPLHACRARLSSVAFLWVELTFEFPRFSLGCVVTHIFLPSDHKESISSIEFLKITAHNNSPTRNTRLTHSQDIPDSPLLHRGVKAILDAASRASSAASSTRDAFLRERTPFAEKTVRDESPT